MYRHVLFRCLSTKKWNLLGLSALSGEKVGLKAVYSLNSLSEYFRKCASKPSQMIPPPQY